MIALGPYEFTTTDALRTMGNLGGLWGELFDRRTSPAAVAMGDDLAARLRVALAASDASDLDALGRKAATKLADQPDVLHAVLDDAWSTLRAAADQLRADGQLPARAEGVVTQLSRSGGGVPKLAVPAVDVGFSGVVGDAQRMRIHHGRPWQALCLFADEVLEALQAEGHPIHRGSAGENITVSGLPWGDVRPGVRLKIGGVLMLVQAYAEPCSTNAAFFVNGNFHAMDKARGPYSRVYATVLEPGSIVTGDAAILEP